MSFIITYLSVINNTHQTNTFSKIVIVIEPFEKKRYRVKSVAVTNFSIYSMRTCFIKKYILHPKHTRAVQKVI